MQTNANGISINYQVDGREGRKAIAGWRKR